MICVASSLGWGSDLKIMKKKTTKNANAPEEKPTEKPLRENPDDGVAPETPETVEIAGQIPEPPPFHPSVTQKGHHEVVQN